MLSLCRVQASSTINQAVAWLAVERVVKMKLLACNKCAKSRPHFQLQSLMYHSVTDLVV